MEKKRIGLIGTGGICTDVHIPGYQKCDDCEITAICDINPKALKAVGDKLNIPEECRFTDYKDLLASGLVDVIDVSTPTHCHVEIAIAALEAGFPVSVEKPVGINFEESLRLRQKSKETGLPVFICFSWRYVPLVRQMRQLMDEHDLGELCHIYIDYIKDSGLIPGRKLEWRFQKELAGTGVLGDLGSHMFDVVRFLTGKEFESVYCETGIVVKERQKIDSEEFGEVTTDDWSNCICRMEDGVGATVKISRIASPYLGYNIFEITGTKGGIRYENYQGERLKICVGDDQKTHTYREVEIAGGFSAQMQCRSFLDIVDGKHDGFAALIEEGIHSQGVIDASEVSSRLGRKVTIQEMFEKEQEI